MLLVTLLLALLLWESLRSPIPTTQLNVSHSDVATKQESASPVLALQEHLTENPNDGHSWLELGKFYLFKGELESALTCFDYSRRLLDQSADSWAGIATAHYYLSSQRMTAKVSAAIDKALTIDEYNEGALTLLASDAYIRFEYQLAIKYWEKIIESDRLGVDREKLVNLINQAKQLQPQSSN